MKKRLVSDIIKDLKSMLAELEQAIDIGNSKHITSNVSQEPNTNYSGPSGGIKMLRDAGFFKEPRTLAETLAELHKEGYIYRKQAVSTALIRLVRQRVLTRIQAQNPKDREKWLYAERK